MAREISIIIRAKNAMAAGLNSAWKSMQGFGQSALRIGKFFATGFLAAGAAVAGFAAKAIAAYSAQEKAEQSLAAAINTHGQSAAALIPELKRVADAIQDETGAADDATLAGMAKMRMLGVQTSKLGEAARAVVALKSVGLEEAAAQKAVAMAMQGNYSMLNRYVPALRDAKTEAEKATIVNELFARGYDQQKAVLGTVSGQWGLLKNRLGDVWEEIGKQIMANGMLRAAITKASEAVKGFVGRIQAWADSGGMVNLVSGVKLFFAEASYIFKMLGNTFAVTWAALSDGCDTVFNYVGNVISKSLAVWRAEFDFFKDYAVAIWKKIKSPTSTFAPPSLDAYKQALRDLGKAVAGESGVVTEATEKALAKRAAIEAEHAKRIEEISKEQAAALIADAKRVAEEKKAALEAEVNMAEQAAKDRVEAEEAAAARKAEADRKAALASAGYESDRLKKSLTGLKAELAEIEKKKAALEETAKSRVSGFIEKQRAAKEDAAAREKDFARADELARREKRGTKLARADKEFLEAARAIDKAQREQAKLGKAGAAVEGKISEAEKALAVQEKIKESLERIEKQNEEILTYAE